MLNKFELLTPATLDEAVTILAGRSDAKIVAGGTDVFVEMHAGKEFPVLMDIKKLQELKGIVKMADGSYKLGALVTHAEILRNAEVCSTYPALADACGKIGSVQVRNRGTIGGNACNASPAGDSLAALMVYDTVMCIKGKSYGNQVPVAGFFTGVKKTVLKQGEMLTHIILPPPVKGSGSAYSKLMARKAMEIAIMGTGACIACDAKGICTHARISLLSSAPTPIRVVKAEEYLTGKALTKENIADAAKIAFDTARPKTWRNKEEYAKDMVKEFVPQTIEAAASRMKGE